MWPFSSKTDDFKAELHAINERIDASYRLALDNEKAKVARLESDILTLRGKVDAAEAKVREQTDNDLIAVSLKILATALIKEQPISKNDWAAQQHLMQQSASWRHMASPLSSYGMGGAFSGLI